MRARVFFFILLSFVLVQASVRDVILQRMGEHLLRLEPIEARIKAHSGLAAFVECVFQEVASNGSGLAYYTNSFALAPIRDYIRSTRSRDPHRWTYFDSLWIGVDWTQELNLRDRDVSWFYTSLANSIFVNAMPVSEITEDRHGSTYGVRQWNAVYLRECMRMQLPGPSRAKCLFAAADFQLSQQFPSVPVPLKSPVSGEKEEAKVYCYSEYSDHERCPSSSAISVITCALERICRPLANGEIECLCRPAPPVFS